MSFDFSETLTLVLPDIEESLDKFSATEFQESHGLIVEIAAIHEGTTSNYNHYSEAELEASLSSWTTPYEKPIILNHDVHTEPLGRVIGARMAKESDGRPYVMLQVAITAPEAIQKVKDKRYLTGSVGGKAEEAVCNICNKDWANYEGAGLPCAHRRGKSYRGKIACMEMRKIGFKEYSFVNVPADSHSSVRSILTAAEAEAEADSENVSSQAHFFALDMTREGIVEYTESGSNDVLANMKKKEATPLYLKLKGSFLSALAIEEAEKGVKADIDNTSSADADDLAEETSMADANTDQVQDDILALVEGLDDEVAVTEEAEETAVEESTDDDEATEEVAEEESADETEEVLEGERPEGQETAGNKDVDPETSEGAPKSRESEDESTDESEEVAEEETATEEQAQDTELSEEEEAVTEPLVEELKSEVASLKEENSRLKAALHKTLVKQVVDAKISAGVVEFEDRGKSIEEHSKRTAASLIDSLKDFASIAPGKGSKPVVPEIDMEEQSEVVGDEEQVITIDSEESDKKTDDPMAVAENVFVDALMGRTKL